MVTKKVNKPKVISSKKEKEDEYKPVFETIVIVGNPAYEFNWVAIRRAIQKMNIFKSMKGKKIEVKSTIIKPLVIKLWNKYCIWFNSTFNKEVVYNGSK